MSPACMPEVARSARPTASFPSFEANSPAAGRRDVNAPTSSDDRKLGVSISALALATPCSSPIGNAIRAAVVMLGVMLEIVGPARAEPAAIARSTTSSPVQPFASFIAEASQRFAISGELDTRGDARRERQQSPCCLAQGRDGADADHAPDLRRVARPLPSRIRTPTTPATTSSPAQPTFARCTIGTARRGSLRRTTRVLTATTNIWRQVGRCQSRRRTTSPCSRR